jgi:1,4-dihydroxy-2-naphthoate octaprenyltransferase
VLWVASRPEQVLLVAAVYALGVAVARGYGAAVEPLPALAGLVALVPTTVAVHYANEYADHETDRLTTPTPFSGGSGALRATGLPPALLGRATVAALAVAAVATLGLAALRAVDPVAVGLLALIAVLGVGYSLGPAFSRRGLGELDNSLLGGMVLPHYGAAVVGPFDLTTCLAVLPFSLVVFCNLLATQWPDRRADAAVGKATLPVRLSRRGVRRLYLLVAFIAAAALVLLTGPVLPLPVALASLAAFPFLLWGAATFARDENPLPSVAAMVVLAAAQLAAWLWVG